MTALVPVAFLEPWGSYNAGDIAGYEPASAQSLVERGIARYHEQPAADFSAENVDLPEDGVTDITQITASVLVVPNDPAEPARYLTGAQVGTVVVLPADAADVPLAEWQTGTSDQPAPADDIPANAGEPSAHPSDQPAPADGLSTNPDGQDAPTI